MTQFGSRLFAEKILAEATTLFRVHPEQNQMMRKNAERNHNALHEQDRKATVFVHP
jgi:hypothetical protein